MQGTENIINWHGYTRKAVEHARRRRGGRRLHSSVVEVRARLDERKYPCTSNCGRAEAAHFLARNLAPNQSLSLWTEGRRRLEWIRGFMWMKCQAWKQSLSRERAYVSARECLCESFVWMSWETFYQQCAKTRPPSASVCVCVCVITNN